MNRLAIFDCDGTLVDSQANICVAMEECFGEAGLPAPDRAAVRRIVGLSLPQAMQVLAPGHDHDLLAEAYKRAFHRMRAEGRVEEQLYEGIPEVLAALEAEGWLLGVATGKSDRGLRLVLEHHGLAHHFVTLQTADRHPSKPHPSMIEQCMADAGAQPATTVMIGDTSFDILMAHNAGVRAIGVAWGYHEADELLREGADAVASHPSDLPALCTLETA
ncbi:HAD-IA family hydrolase [Sphingomonas sp. CGMCC 1.13654]|uniref:HAD-IA family hydrolase n=1 Tax=Sphingomonas chungangi TaxID=2683589 RepID=A0A838L692_9SPHN|nr:HAD-IA family hydrolase [Sphingomonas chungangi]MBA2933098.1 HAD-IA family hydrolase [Sphingomonas chungangi]MVW56718.1 HAD-IA family hydrolase [Sphingomonas chungangi]